MGNPPPAPTGGYTLLNLLLFFNIVILVLARSKLLK